MGLPGAEFRRVTRGVEESRIEEAAATENCPWRGGVLQGQVHDDNCWAMGGYAGHAGAFGAVRDVPQFSAELSTRFLSRETLQAAWTRVSEPPGCERTLGWDTPSGQDPAASSLFSPRSVGHLGFTGTSLWIDPDAGLAAALLSNRVHPSRENAGIKPFRARFHRALREDLGR
jgi:CubicO group peptidase (beta-lactamase class C family)